MNKIWLLLSFAFLHFFANAQPYWQQEVNYTIKATLNDKDHTIEAFLQLEYINHSPDSLTYIWFHLWPNAYKNDRTAFSEQMLKLQRTDFYFSKAQDKGYINQLDFKADGVTTRIQLDSNNIDIVALILPKPLPPGNSTVITTPFKVKLPGNFSRSGHVGNNYQVAQWYPKPAVYDRKGWHPMPYLEQGEFYSEFGRYDVQITVPKNYLVAATGILQDTTTLKTLKENKNASFATDKTWHFKQNNIHDFAWFASKDYTVSYDTVRLASNKIIDVFSYYKKGNKTWLNSLAFAKDGLKKYSNWIGDYPYSIMSVVEGLPNKYAGGMEYPTITFISTPEGGHDLDATIVHETGHNWFYGALASNERSHPWMDEGMNTFFQKKYEKEKYGSYFYLKDLPFALDKKLPDDEEAMLLSTMAKIMKDQPIETPSPDFSGINYDLVAYYKASRWMKMLHDELGEEAFYKAMHNYYEEWKFKHPYPEDFKASFEKSTGKNLDAVFKLLNETGTIEKSKATAIKPSFLFNLKNTDKYNYINIAPVAGYNHYDKGMIGGLLHNYKLPLNKFQFAGGALYSSSTKQFHPFGHASYNIYKRKYHVSTAVSYMSYNKDDFAVDESATLYMGVKRFVPSLTVTFFPQDVHSTRRIKAQWKSFFLTEGNLDFNTITTPTDTFDVVDVVENKSTIHRLNIGIEDDRKLFPYSINFSADKGNEFIRTGITGKCYFNYADNKSGMSARFFAGKFFYLESKTFLTQYNNDRYLLNMSAPKGAEDYTYSDYFIGRNEFEGWKSQQVMERDGFFKVNTDLLGNKVGKTDDWLMALNLASDIPSQINPLSILDIPVKVFVDIGTYAEAWKDNAGSGRFIYDAGLQVSLFASLVNIYLPLLYSKVYSDYYKSTISENRFMKTISFNIDISRLKPKELLKGIPL